MALSNPEIERFHRDGYVIVDFALEQSLLDDIVESVSGLFARRAAHRSDARRTRIQRTRIQDAWRFVPSVRELALNETVLHALRDLFGREPLPFQTLNFWTGTQQKPHSDTIHFNSRPSGYMVGVWTALEDVDEGNGALVYYPGSHRLPEITMQDIGVAPLQENYPAYEKHIASVIEQRGLQAARGVMKKGQSFIWHANLLHGGGRHTDSNRTRHSQVTHYFFEGCEYYTPMLSTETAIFRRDPEWITADAPYRRFRPDGKTSAALLERIARKLKSTLTGR